MNSSTNQGRIKVVLDTNIVVSALIAKHGAPARIFEKLLLQEIENYTSKEIIEELTNTLKRKEIKKRTTRKAREFILRNYKRFSFQIVPQVRKC